jgi:uncharacterized protein YhbP (UPF0306 family)
MQRTVLTFWTKKENVLDLCFKEDKNIFTKQCASQYDVTTLSCVIAHKIAKNSKPFSDQEFAKECVAESTSIICADRKALLKESNLSR